MFKDFAQYEEPIFSIKALLQNYQIIISLPALPVDDL